MFHLPEVWFFVLIMFDHSVHVFFALPVETTVFLAFASDSCILRLPIKDGKHSRFLSNFAMC